MFRSLNLLNAKSGAAVSRPNGAVRSTRQYSQIAEYKYPKFGGKLVIVGWGAIAKASITMIMKHFQIDPKNITVVNANNTDRDLALKYGLNFVAQTLTPHNTRSFLSQYLSSGDMLLNLSVDVSSVDIVELTQSKGAMYMDTCVEPYAGGYAEGTLADRTNYIQREKAIALKSKFGKGTPTSLFAHGINPGLISSILKQALVNIANDTQLENFSTPTTRDEWASLMHRLGVKVVHISERDTQVLKEPKRPGQFLNTWSVHGFISEGVFQSAELGWGSHEKEMPFDGLQHTTGSRAAIYLSRPGASTKVRTWAPIEKNFHGFLVTHNESISIAEYFSEYNPKGELAFRPTVHYAYHPCDAAVSSVHEILGKDGVTQPETKVIFDEILDGHDELGVLVMGHKKHSYWFGSIQDVHTARKLVPHNNATSLQVAAGVLSGMTHCIESQKDGVIEAEDLNHEKAIASARQYLGRVVGEYTDWTPIKGYSPLFPRPVDLADPWQFKNFRVF